MLGNINCDGGVYTRYTRQHEYTLIPGRGRAQGNFLECPSRVPRQFRLSLGFARRRRRRLSSVFFGLRAVHVYARALIRTIAALFGTKLISPAAVCRANFSDKLNARVARAEY